MKPSITFICLFSLALTVYNQVLNDTLPLYANDSKIRAALPKGSNQVVFIGDSLTNYWDNFFPDKPTYVNRGIPAQTTWGVLNRFELDVLALQPDVVVILAGINDILPAWASLPLTKSRIMRMGELADSRGINVIMGSVMPLGKKWMFDMTIIIEHNKWLKKLCEASGYTYVDYFSVLAAENNCLKEEFTTDDIHLTAPAYRLIEPVIEKAIEETLNNNRNREPKIYRSDVISNPVVFDGCHLMYI